MDGKVEVHAVSSDRLEQPLALLRMEPQGGGSLTGRFLERVARSVGAGDLEMLAASCGGRMVGVLVLAFRPSLSLGGEFASVEDLYVEPATRRRGVGRALMEAAERRVRERGVSYVELQTDGEAAPFYGTLGYESEPEARVMSRSLVVEIRSRATPRETQDHGGCR